MRPCVRGAANALNDIAVNLRRQFLLFLWRDKRIPPVVPLSCLANKMSHSRNLCKSPGKLCGVLHSIVETANCFAWHASVAYALRFSGWSEGRREACAGSPMSLVGQRGCTFWYADGAPRAGAPSIVYS